MPANSGVLREFLVTIRLASDEDKDAIWAILTPFRETSRVRGIMKLAGELDDRWLRDEEQG